MAQAGKGKLNYRCPLCFMRDIDMDMFYDKDKNEYINRMINIFFNLISALCICIIAVMPFLFPVLVNQGYKDAYYQIPVLMIAVFFQALQGLYSSIYVALKKTKEIAKTRQHNHSEGRVGR